jgi:acyl-CoA dehydrogenase
VALAPAAPPRIEGGAGAERLSGLIDGVPWGREASFVAVLAANRLGGHWIAVLDGAGLDWRRTRNLAGEPRDTLVLDGARPLAVLAADAEAAWAAAALMRAAQLAGAMRAALRIAAAHAAERKQFGRPLLDFQAIQHQLAAAAEEVSAAETAVAAAASSQPGFPWRAGIAKARAGEAAGIVAAAAHQVVGALGFTREFHLQQMTRRLWAWRDEFGTEAWWHRRLGAEVLQRGAGSVWPLVLGEQHPAQGRFR